RPMMFIRKPPEPVTKYGYGVGEHCTALQSSAVLSTSRVNGSRPRTQNFYSGLTGKITMQSYKYRRL
ncbi:MAG: hypothetical protein AB7P49_10800, partial [Bdellovibrionales bacterium]